MTDASRGVEAAGGIMCGDGGCVHLSAEDAQAIYRAAKAEQAERVARLPDETSAIRAMCDGWVRLKEMGWREAMYAPKGEPLELIEVGSSGIHRGYRDEFGFWIDDGDTWPSSACLWRPERDSSLISERSERLRGLSQDVVVQALTPPSSAPAVTPERDDA